MVRSLAMSLSVVLWIGFGCAGGSERNEPEHARAERCYNGAGAITHDEAREAHQTGGPPVGGYSTGGGGTRARADQPPEWWGRGDDVEPCGQDEERAELEGPLLLQQSGPRRDDSEPADDGATGDVAPE